MRECKKCFILKPETEFGRKTKTQLHSYCKPCVRQHSKEHYRNNTKGYRDRIDAKKSFLRKLLIDLKNDKACMDCGIIYPYYVMDFDHRDASTKIAEVSKLVSNGELQALLDEIAKCDLVCANCHRRRTYLRALSNS